MVIIDRECPECEKILYLDCEYQPADYDIGVFPGYNCGILTLEALAREGIEPGPPDECKCPWHEPEWAEKKEAFERKVGYYLYMEPDDYEDY